MNCRTRCAMLAFPCLFAVALVDSQAGAQPVCFQTPGPNVICGDMAFPASYAALSSESGTIDAFAWASTHCNIGTVNLQIVGNSTNHPVIAQHLYRYNVVDGVSRMEQVGLSWVSHTFTALTQNLCCNCNGQGGSVLGAGCSDPVTAGYNGTQMTVTGGLGPRFEINAHSGEFPWPYTFRNVAHIPHTSITRRLQVRSEDLEPRLNAGALYFAENQYVAKDDSNFQNQNDNASHRRIMIASVSPGEYTAANVPGSPTVRGVPAIRAWKVNDPNVVEAQFETPEHSNLGGDTTGTAILAALVQELPDQPGIWHYEYALYNMNSHRSFASITIPFHAPHLATITDIGFHDVFYHSGDGYNSSIDNVVTFDGTDWPATLVMTPPGHAGIRWQLVPDEVQGWENSNALRWGTTYNFRFRTNRPPTLPSTSPTSPTAGGVKIGLFRPGPEGSPDSVVVTGVPVPQGCIGDIAPLDRPTGFVGDGRVDADDLVALLSAWGPCTKGELCAADLAPPSPPTGDGIVNVDDLVQLLAAWGECSL